MKTTFTTSIAMVLALSLIPAVAVAQGPGQEAMELSREGMVQYNNLEVEAARATLRRALQVAEDSGVAGASLARIYMNMGVVLVGGLQDNASGMEAFENALRADPDARLDPLTATPEITTVFTMAQRRAGQSGSDLGGTEPQTDVLEPEAPDTLVTEAPGLSSLPRIPHEPIQEQLEGTALPVFVEVPAEAPVAEVTVFYRAEGIEDFERVSMARLQDGFGTEIPCTTVLQPAVEYYLVAYAEGSEPLGASGSPEAPLRVRVVPGRSMPAPSLPGQEPPPEGVCGAPIEAISETVGDTGQSCESDVECPLDYICEVGVCQLASDFADEQIVESTFVDEEEAPRFFVHVSGFWGSAYVGGGRPADSNPPASDPTNPAWVPESMSPEAGGLATECENNGDGLIDYCVRLENSGIVPTFGLRLAVGYYLLPRLALAAVARWQPNAGRGTLAGVLLGARLQYEFTRPRARGLHFAAFLGTTAGQIQPQPPQNGLANEPFVRSGLNGIQAGGVFTYRFVRNLGIVITPELMIQVPEFLFNIDISAGLEFAL